MSDVNEHLETETGKKDQIAGEKLREIVAKHKGQHPMDFLKALVIEYKAAQEEYKKRKFASDVAAYIQDGIKNVLIEAFQEANEDKVHIKDIGTCYMSRSWKAKVPASQEEKLALYQYIEHKYGELQLENMRSINYQKLNSWLAEEAKALEVEKKDLKIPGLGEIELELNIGLRKS
jgi:hypothetical protein